MLNALSFATPLLLGSVMAGACYEKSRRLHRQSLGLDAPHFPGSVLLPIYEMQKKTRRSVMVEIFGILF